MVSRKGHWRVWLACGVAAALVAGGCRKADDRAPALRVWAMGKEGEYLWRRFQGALVAGHRVSVQRIPWSAAHEKLLTSFVAGTFPDVVQMGTTWIPEFSAIGAILCEPAAPFRESDFFPGAADTAVFEGSWCATPWYVDTRLIFYRRDLLSQAGFDKPPRTWAEWREAMEQMRKLGPHRYGLLAPLDEWHLLIALAFQCGAELLRDRDTRGNFQSDAFRRAFSFYVSLFRDGLAPFGGEARVANVYQDFAAGLFTFYVTGPWNLGEFRHRLPEALQTQWATAVLPTPELGMPSISVMGGASLAIHRSSRRRDAARALVQQLLTDEEQAQFHRLTGNLPAVRSAWERLKGDDGGRLAAFREQLEHARATPKVPEWERIAALVVQYTELVVRGELAADAALKRLDSEVDRVLDKRRWLLQRAGSRP
ncbi:MAG: sugar ABC transporter substrate-binding protein [Candidatus Binatia bacterium]|nr:MAG: sugar ABC transporter substrate-binding protein [Candidatus Binatia bacterium]